MRLLSDSAVLIGDLSAPNMWPLAVRWHPHRDTSKDTHGTHEWRMGGTHSPWQTWHCRSTATAATIASCDHVMMMGNPWAIGVLVLVDGFIVATAADGASACPWRRVFHEVVSLTNLLAFLHIFGWAIETKGGIKAKVISLAPKFFHSYRTFGCLDGYQNPALACVGENARGFGFSGTGASRPGVGLRWEFGIPRFDLVSD